MKVQIKKFQEVLKEWLIRNELDHDTEFYTPQEWRQQKQEYLNEADLVITFEGVLHTLLNFGGLDGGDEIIDELENLAESFGYYYELGNNWNLGFYPIEDYNFSPLAKSYKEKLSDIRWQRKRKSILDRANNKCEDCGAENCRLEVHHCYYLRNCEPWEYPNDALRSLCRNCHIERAKVEMRMRALTASLPQKDLDNLRKALSKGLSLEDNVQFIDAINTLAKNNGE